MVKCIESKNVGKETEWTLERGSILSMKKVAIIILIVALVLANFSASAEVLLFENIVSMGGMNYFSNEVVNATENEYVVEIFSDEIMTTISPSIVRWRWVRDDPDADWMYSYKGCPVVGARLEDGHNPSWDLLEVQYQDENGEFVGLERQAVAFDKAYVDEFYADIEFHEYGYVSTKTFYVKVICEYDFDISVFDENGNARWGVSEVTEGFIWLTGLHTGETIHVTARDGEMCSLEQVYIF